jgi:hypothetical protein
MSGSDGRSLTILRIGRCSPAVTTHSESSGASETSRSCTNLSKVLSKLAARRSSNNTGVVKHIYGFRRTIWKLCCRRSCDGKTISTPSTDAISFPAAQYQRLNRSSCNARDESFQLELSASEILFLDPSLQRAQQTIVGDRAIGNSFNRM